MYEYECNEKKAISKLEIKRQNMQLFLRVVFEYISFTKHPFSETLILPHDILSPLRVLSIGLRVRRVSASLSPSDIPYIE